MCIYFLSVSCTRIAEKKLVDNYVSCLKKLIIECVIMKCVKTRDNKKIVKNNIGIKARINKDKTVRIIAIYI